MAKKLSRPSFNDWCSALLSSSDFCEAHFDTLQSQQTIHHLRSHFLSKNNPTIRYDLQEEVNNTLTMAALDPTRRHSAPVKSNVRIPAWLIARRLSGRLTPQGSPDSFGKRTVQTLPSEDDESLALPRMDSRRPSLSSSSTLLKMDVSGFRVEDLHVDVDTVSRKLCLAGNGPCMFKRSFPIPAYDQVDISKISASVVVEGNGRKCLILQAPAGSSSEDSVTVNSQGRRSIRIKDATRPPIGSAMSLK